MKRIPKRLYLNSIWIAKTVRMLNRVTNALEETIYLYGAPYNIKQYKTLKMSKKFLKCIREDE